MNQKHGISLLSCIPIRLESNDKSEIVSQLLFGEMYEIINIDKKWTRISCHLDNYEGFIDTKQIGFISEKEFNKIITKPIAYNTDLSGIIHRNEEHTPILIGSSLNGFDGIQFKLNKEAFVFNGQTIAPNEVQITGELLTKLAKKYLNAPYLWGGRSPFGIDCSGFTQVVFKMCGIVLPRDAYQQAEEGELVNFLTESEAGDLAFFANEEGRITHVGIMLNNEQIIHASGKVRIDKIDHFGIYNDETKKYSHTLRFIKRFL